MKKILAILVFTYITILACGQTNVPIVLDSKNMVGRWIETERCNEQARQNDKPAPPAILILKGDGTFGKGEYKDGVIVLDSNSIAGRLLEIQPRQINNPALAVIFIFKEDGTFHKGEDKDGVIIFGIAGTYTVAGDSVTVKYRDFMNKRANGSKERTMVIKVTELSENEVSVKIRDSWHSRYTSVLRRQEATEPKKTK